MSQGPLPFQYEAEERASGVTSFAGLPIYLDLFEVARVGQLIRDHVPDESTQGWTAWQEIQALVLLNLAGGDCIDDLAVLESDEGFTRVYRRVETYGMSRSEREELDARWRMARQRTLPSPAAVHRFLRRFHDESQEERYWEKREAHEAYIWEPNEALVGLGRVNTELVAVLQHHRPKSTVTMDLDATLVESAKKEAAYTYKHFRGYQPVQMWWHEQGVLLHSEFRDGNVPAQSELLRIVKESVERVPPGVDEAYLRSDTAGYQIDLMRYCAEGRDPRFGVIGFAISADVTPALKQAVAEHPVDAWNPLLRHLDGQELETGQEWAEIVYVPEWAGYSKKAPRYRFIAVREPLAQLSIPHVEEQQDLPFPTMRFGASGRYKLHAIVSNRLGMSADDLIWWHRARCGKSEEAHAIMKTDLAGGKMPSGYFGANAAWWMIMVLAFTLHALLRGLAFPEPWQKRRLKAWRLSLIRLTGRLVEHGRRLFIRLPHGHSAHELLLEARQRLLECGGRGPPATAPA